MAAGISFFMVSSSDLKYKLMRHVTFNPLLFWISPGLISCIFIRNKKKSVWYNFYQGTSVSITFYIFEHYQLWIVKPKGSSFQRHQNCVCGTLKSGTVTILS